MSSVSQTPLQLDTSPWRGGLSCDLTAGTFPVCADGVVLIDENGVAWAVVLPDRGGFYGHATRIVEAVNAYDSNKALIEHLKLEVGRRFTADEALAFAARKNAQA